MEPTEEVGEKGRTVLRRVKYSGLGKKETLLRTGTLEKKETEEIVSDGRDESPVSVRRDDNDQYTSVQILDRRILEPKVSRDLEEMGGQGSYYRTYIIRTFVQTINQLKFLYTYMIFELPTPLMNDFIIKFFG